MPNHIPPCQISDNFQHSNAYSDVLTEAGSLVKEVNLDSYYSGRTDELFLVVLLLHPDGDRTTNWNNLLPSKAP